MAPRSHRTAIPAVRLDVTDQRIIGALQADGRRPFSRIAADVGVSESVVRYRVQRLERDEILQVVGIADPLRIGFDHMAMLGLKVRPGCVEQVCEAVSGFPETSYVANTAGSFDALAEVVCRDTAAFAELLQNRIQLVDGVLATETFFILKIHKMAYGWGVGDVVIAPSREAA